jgi:hypothetical protein
LTCGYVCISGIVSNVSNSFEAYVEVQVCYINIRVHDYE